MKSPFPVGALSNELAGMLSAIDTITDAAIEQ